MNKKGVMFTLIALLLAGLFIILFSTTIETPLDAKQPIVESRINVMKSYVKNLESYTGDILSVSSKDALSSVLDYMYNFNYSARNERDFSCMFERMLVNATINATKEAKESTESFESLCFIARVQNETALFSTLDVFNTPSEKDKANKCCNLLVSPPPCGGRINIQGSGTTAFQDFKVQQTGILTEMDFVAKDNQFNLGSSDLFFEIYEDVYAPACREVPVASSQLMITPPDSDYNNYTALFNSTYVFEPSKVYHIKIYTTATRNITLIGPDRVTPAPANLGEGMWSNLSVFSAYTHKGMVNQTLNYWLNKLGNFSRDELRIYTDFRVQNISIEQKYPWDLDVGLDVVFDVSCKEAILTKKYSFDNLINIEGLLDPLYFFNNVSSNWYYNKTIKKTPFIYDTDFNLYNFSIFYNNEEYRVNRNGTSFLQRAMNLIQNGTQGSECCGIESMIGPNITAIFPDGMPNSLRVSYVDYLYFYDDKTGFSYGINKTYPINETAVLNAGWPLVAWSVFWSQNKNFKLEVPHLIELNINNSYWDGSYWLVG